MGNKPSLTLELDSHTADAGVDTRIEAFLDIVKSYVEINRGKKEKANDFKIAETLYEDGKLFVIDSSGKKYSLKDKRVKVMFPSMGRIGNRFIAAAMSYRGINTVAMGEPGKDELNAGKNVSLCKECMPLMLTTGTLLKYLKERESSDEVLLYFMPETAGPCRFGQYNTFVKTLLQKDRIADVAVLSLTADNGYAGLGNRFAIRAWQGIVVDEVLEEIYSNLLVVAKDKDKAIKIYDEVVDKIIKSLSNDSWKEVKKVLKSAVEKLSEIETKFSIEDAKKVALVGEIYVRRDAFSKSGLIEKMAEKDIIVKVSPASEWIYYCDYIVKKRLSTGSTEADKYRTILISWFKEHFEKKIKKMFGKLKFYTPHMIDVEKVVKSAEGLISPNLTGEAILTVGAAINEILDEVSGVINIGPFGCMPSRIAEAVLNEKLEEKKIELCGKDEKMQETLKEFEHLPFITIEVDGSPLPQLMEAKLESFALQVERVHNYMKETR
jgi:predicted nucleotide-binding protein (sugar kinase/HSP70/actin superfamily)